MKKTRYTKEELELFVKDSTHMADLLRKLYQDTHGSHYGRVKSKLIKWGIDTSHWKTPRNHFKIPSKADVLCKSETRRDGKTLKKYMIREGVKEICSICGQTNEWNDKPLVIQVDHINGDNLDSRLENLRFLCPNCHTQTETYCGKNRPPKNKCLNCECRIRTDNRYCRPCSYKFKKTPTDDIIPTREVLLDLLTKHRLIELEKHFNVDQRTILSWARKMEISLPIYPNGFWVKEQTRQSFTCLHCKEIIKICECFNIDE